MKKRIVALILGTTMVLGSLFSTGVYASSVVEDGGEITGNTEETLESNTGKEEVSEEDAALEDDDSVVEDSKGIKEDVVMDEEPKEDSTKEENLTEDTQENTESDKYSNDELAEHAEILASIRQSIQGANLDLTVEGSSSEEDEECEVAFEDYGSSSDEVSFYSASEYDSVPEIGSKHEIGSLTQDYGVGLWQRTAIDVVDYWDGYSSGWDIVDGWDRGVIGTTFPNSPSGGTPMWCLQPGKNFVRTNRLIGNALDFLSQDEITCLGLIDKYCDENINQRFIKPGGFPNQEDGLWSAKYGMKQLAFWTFLESTRPSFPNGYFVNHNGVGKTVHNAPVMFEANAQFEGGGYWFINEAVKYALAHKNEYKGYGKVAYNTTIENQLVGLFTVQHVAKPKADLEIIKSSANSAITSNNGNYSLAGAIYGVYRDQSCKSEVGRITTDSSGKGKISNLDLGTYYVKEIKASPGYELDTNVHAITLTR